MAEARRLYRRLGNRHGEGAQLVNLGTLYRRLGRYADAAEHQREAAAVFVELGDLRLQGYALGNLGAVYTLLGRHPEAVAHLEDALALCRRTADRGGEASALGTLGAAQARAGRPAEALEYLHREGRYAGRGQHDEPRLILLDVKLPLIDGPEVLRRIKADPRTRHLPVVMLTTSTEDVDLRRCYEYGANSYIVKPVDMERFFRAVQDIGTYWLELNKTEAST